MDILYCFFFLFLICAGSLALLWLIAYMGKQIDDLTNRADESDWEIRKMKFDESIKNKIKTLK